MSICPADGWVAVYTRTDDSSTSVPILVWKEGCTDGVDTIVGYVLMDRDGIALPYPVAAPDVFGFLYYAKEDPSGNNEVFGLL